MQKLAPIPAFIVFLSGYSPLGLIITLLDFNLPSWSWNHPYVVLSILFLFLFSMLFTRWHFRKYSDGTPVKVLAAEDKSPDILNYAIPYIAGFAAIDVAALTQLMAVFLVIWIIFLITYRTHSVVVNPFLIELGYRVHSVHFVYPGGREVKGELLGIRESFEKGKIYRLKQISSYCYIHTNEPKHETSQETTETPGEA